MDSSVPPTEQSDHVSPLAVTLARARGHLRWLFAFFLVPRAGIVRTPTIQHPYFLRARQQILVGITRAGAVLGLLTFCIALPPLVGEGLFDVIAIQAIVVSFIWILALYRPISYTIKASMLLLGMYALALNELLHFGYSEDGYAFFAAFSLLALLFFDRHIGIAALGVSVATIALMGWQISVGLFQPFSYALKYISVSTVITTSLIFLIVVGTIQVGIAILFHHLHLAWQNEYIVRTALERERDLLEQRVAERTSELSQAHAQAVEASRVDAEQKAYLAVLHDTALDLFNRRDLNDLLQAIVDRAAAILDAPYGELMLHEHDELVVVAFTQNQSFLHGDRVRRDEAILSWRCFDTREPVVLEDYSAWAERRTIYSDVQLRAIADIPIMAGENCLGVLAMGRVQAGASFTDEDIVKGLAFSRLAALALDNAHLYATALREINERKQAEQSLQQFAAELQAHNAELNAFAHTVAHDLKNPLTGLMGSVQLLQFSQRTMSDEQRDDVLRIMDTTVQKMATIISELLLLASIRAKDAIPKQNLAMEHIVSSVEVRLQDHITATRACIEKPASWPVAAGYAPWVEEVWANYLSNALKYGGNPPKITLGANETDDGFVRFWVRDNGSGIRKTQQAQLFTPFTRLRSARAEGHGLGLSIVQRIIQRLGGSVGVESTLGEGSTFYFTLPVPAPVDPPGE